MMDCSAMVPSPERVRTCDASVRKPGLVVAQVHERPFSSIVSHAWTPEPQEQGIRLDLTVPDLHSLLRSVLNGHRSRSLNDDRPDHVRVDLAVIRKPSRRLERE